MGVLVVLMVATNVVTAMGCPSENKLANISYAIFSTLACWSVFIFIVYGREYFRMSFANVFGYLWVSKKANDIITKIIPKSRVDFGELLENISKNPATKYKIENIDLEKMMEATSKTRIDDTFELLTYLRSGENFVPSLKYVKDFTNKMFDPSIGTAIDAGVDTVKDNADLVELLDVLYTRDVIGEIILFVMAGVMCSYLSEYLIKKIN
jgi:hypothetical protein